ncbi:putative actinidain [Medicago truncatula]|uniref:Vignain n=1 Tax=Medicago truncatula TaxID=3880 RepID=G7JDS5_MEDTR|nr:senescence-specific cysteine protease SAG39 [Medicago truncatula]AES89820.1 papain family cysteine protease [Medicago truncatula]RHN61883.1 putative actinidain [Medicago truncatula]
MTSPNNFIIPMFLIFTTWMLPYVMSSRVLEPYLSNKHEKWMTQFGKSYKDAAEKEKRFQIFKNNVEFIELFNAVGNKPFNLSINHFADLTNEEFKASLNGNKKLHDKFDILNETTSFRYHNVTSVPASMDWRKRGAVTPIKNQGSCGSCWAFSTVASIEGIHQITTGELVSLSEQELIDCVRGNSSGCSGGYLEDAFKFIAKKGGMASETNYPYKETDEKCKFKKESKHVAEIKGYEKVPSNSENDLLKAVANQPVSVYVDAGDYVFQFYSGGIFTGKCGTDTDHVVTIVGYGVSLDYTEYWLVKNSWGTGWGEKGYMKLKRNVDSKKGLCGIATNPSYPVA